MPLNLIFIYKQTNSSFLLIGSETFLLARLSVGGLIGLSSFRKKAGSTKLQSEHFFTFNISKKKVADLDEPCCRQRRHILIKK